MEEVLKAIGEPHRRRILQLVAEQELTAGEISDHFTISRPAVSQHITVLKKANLIMERRLGTRRLYRTRRQGFAEAKIFLDSFWNGQSGSAVLEGWADGNELPERLSVQRDVVIDAAPDVVWDTLTNADQINRWLGRSASLEPRPGGLFLVEVIPEQYVVGEYVTLDPPHRLVHTWGWVGDSEDEVPTGSTLVHYELIPTHDGGSFLRLRHQDLPTLQSAGTHSRGWQHYLERLAVVAAGGDPGTDPWIEDPAMLMAQLQPARPVSTMNRNS